MPTPLAHLAVGARRVVALRNALPEKYRPAVQDVFADLDDARAEIVRLAAKGRHDEAHGIAIAWGEQAAGRVTHALVNAPLTEQPHSRKGDSR